MIGIIDYILEVRVALNTFASAYYLKQNNGGDCFTDKLNLITATIYLEIVSSENIFPNLTTAYQTKIITCLNKILNVKKTLDLDNLIYSDLVKVDESSTGVIL